MLRNSSSSIESDVTHTEAHITTDLNQRQKDRSHRKHKIKRGIVQLRREIKRDFKEIRRDIAYLKETLAASGAILAANEVSLAASEAKLAANAVILANQGLELSYLLNWSGIDINLQVPAKKMKGF